MPVVPVERWCGRRRVAGCVPTRGLAMLAARIRVERKALLAFPGSVVGCLFQPPPTAVYSRKPTAASARPLTCTS